MIIAIISVRGESKGIKDKNIIPFCGKPLICHTIEKTLRVKGIDRIYVSSDSDIILKIANDYPIHLIKQPSQISTDESHSVEAWKYVIGYIERQSNSNEKIDTVVTVQNTSPLCEAKDIQKGLEEFNYSGYDSLFSACEVRDMFLWNNNYGKFESTTYNYKNRKLRQNIKKQYLENGAFYIFKPEILKENNNMLGGIIGVSNMSLWKMFEINDPEDIPVCEALYKAFIL